MTVPQSCITYSGIDFEVGRYVEHSFTKGKPPKKCIL